MQVDKSYLATMFRNTVLPKALGHADFESKILALAPGLELSHEEQLVFFDMILMFLFSIRKDKRMDIVLTGWSEPKYAKTGWNIKQSEQYKEDMRLKFYGYIHNKRNRQQQLLLLLNAVAGHLAAY